MSEAFLNCSLPYTLRHSQELMIRLTGVPGILLSLRPQIWDLRHGDVTVWPFLCEYWEFELRSHSRALSTLHFTPQPSSFGFLTQGFL